MFQIEAKWEGIAVEMIFLASFWEWEFLELGNDILHITYSWQLENSYIQVKPKLQFGSPHAKWDVWSLSNWLQWS